MNFTKPFFCPKISAYTSFLTYEYVKILFYNLSAGVIMKRIREYVLDRHSELYFALVKLQTNFFFEKFWVSFSSRFLENAGTS